jgi:hypothetical protein
MWPLDENAVADESCWIYEQFARVDADELYERYLRVCDKSTAPTSRESCVRLMVPFDGEYVETEDGSALCAGTEAEFHEEIDAARALLFWLDKLGFRIREDMYAAPEVVDQFDLRRIVPLLLIEEAKRLERPLRFFACGSVQDG